MASNYFVDCECGEQIHVELFHAGTERSCPSCNRAVRVPSSNKLKELVGDNRPFMRAIEKVRTTVQSGEPPFDGRCHGCNNRNAAYSTPFRLNVMVERHVADDGGIRPTITGGVKLFAAASEEFWQTTTFPLLLCQQCQSRFQFDRRFARIKAWGKLAFLLGLLAFFIYFAYHNAEFIAAWSGIIWLIGAIAWAARFRDTRKFDPFVNKWIQNIRWVPEALSGEDEFNLSIGRTTSIESR